MAVFTSVTLTELDAWIKQFPLGAARSIQGISSGIENSNFFISTDAGDYVLTIFENLTAEQLPFYLHLMDHLARHGIPVPAPIANHDGQLMTPLHGKPAAIVSKLAGSSQMSPANGHCSAVGAMLARMHLAGKTFAMHQENLRGLSWWRQTVPQVSAFLTDDQRRLLNAAMAEQEQFAASTVAGQLPSGPIHADLFRNNVMFDGDRLTGFFDFYFAGCDRFAFDLAVTCNDWCVDLDTGRPHAEREQTMLDAYQSVRMLEPAELQAWPVMLRGAALRFWLSRLYDFHLPRPAHMLTPHDPSHFERILRMRS